MSQKHERVVVTGASRGIGAAVALALARPGRHLVLLARTEEGLAVTSERVRRGGATSEYHCVDMSHAEGVAVFARQMREAGEVDVLVINAGVSNNAPFVEARLEDLQTELTTNYISPVIMLREILPSMLARRCGHVVIIGSLTALAPFPGKASYTATKAALLALVRSLRAELKGSGVHVGIVLPGHTRTAMTRGRRATVPVAEPQEVAAAVVRCMDRSLGTEELDTAATREKLGWYPTRSLHDDLDLMLETAAVHHDLWLEVNRRRPW